MLKYGDESTVNSSLNFELDVVGDPISSPARSNKMESYRNSPTRFTLYAQLQICPSIL